MTNHGSSVAPPFPVPQLSLLEKDTSLARATEYFPRFPERLHPMLSSWLKDMNKLSRLIIRLQELASAAPFNHRLQLTRQVGELQAVFKRQQDRCVEFLQLSEAYAYRYLLDISAEIRRQSSFLEMLEKRVDMTKTLRDKAVDLQRSYESGTMDAMKNVYKTALSPPLPEDFDLFNEVDFVLIEIRRCYMELGKFWREEICRAIKALETRHVTSDDVERWRGFKARLEQTIQSWKNSKQDCSIWNTSHNHPPGSSGADIGAIASSLSSASRILEEALRRVRDSASMEFSYASLAPVLQVNLGLTQNSELCLAFLRRCVDFGEVVVVSSAAFIAYPTFSRVEASSNLRGRAMALRTEVVDILAENTAYHPVPGSRKFHAMHRQSLSLHREMALELNTLLESVLSWIVTSDRLPNAPQGGCGFNIGLLRSLADAWEKERASMRMTLAALTDDPSERLRYHTLSLSSPRSRPSITQWMIRLVHLNRQSPS
ncbi:hypothetical protein BC826DRAFT_391213 [Russula brevipes]|nr:hypothetical protein BC826DRAFT_391213 [Russula brevipes]